MSFLPEFWNYKWIFYTDFLAFQKITFLDLKAIKININENHGVERFSVNYFCKIRFLNLLSWNQNKTKITLSI